MTWQEHFKEQLQLLEGHAELQAGSPELLRYAIDTQVITEEAYFEWLKKNSHSPVLSGSFFTEKNPNPQFWQKYREIFTWSPNLIPIGEWEGKLIVAGLAKPPEFNTDFIFVHTSIMGLQRFWDAYHNFEVPPVDLASSHGEAPVSLQTAEAPEGVQLHSFNSQQAPAPAAEAGFSFDDFESSELDSESSDSEVEEDHETLDLGAADFSSGPKEQTNVNLDFSNLTHTQAAANPQASTPPSPPVFSKPLEKEIEATVVEDSLSLSLGQELGQEAEENSSSSPVEVPTPAARVAADEPVAARPKIQAPERALKAVPSDVSVLMAPKQLSYSLINWDEKALKAVFQEVFEKMRTHFDKSLIINISDDETRCKVYAWDSAFSTPPTDPVINLMNPSVFYIAAKTTKPFHGPISHSEENEKFFKAWNGNALPAHVTIVPLIYSDKVVALLVGLGEPSAYNRATLNFTEKMANKITETLPTSIKKAA